MSWLLLDNKLLDFQVVNLYEAPASSASMVATPGLGIFGREFVFPDKTISLLCKQATYVQSVSLYGIERSDIKGMSSWMLYLMHLHQKEDVQVKNNFVIQFFLFCPYRLCQIHCVMQS
jgi:hypothetical protein